MESHKQDRPPPTGVWAYGYEISPPLPRRRLRLIEALVGEEHARAKQSARTWEGRLVAEEQVTHILVVSDSPDQSLEVNQKLEAELERLKARFSLTTPLEVERP